MVLVVSARAGADGRKECVCRGTHADEVEPVEALARDDGDELGLAEEGDFGGGQGSGAGEGSGGCHWWAGGGCIDGAGWRVGGVAGCLGGNDCGEGSERAAWVRVTSI